MRQEGWLLSLYRSERGEGADLGGVVLYSRALGYIYDYMKLYKLKKCTMRE